MNRNEGTKSNWENLIHFNTQDAGFLPWFLTFTAAVFSSCSVLEVFCLWVCLLQVKCMLSWIQVRGLTWPFAEHPTFFLSKSFGLFPQVIALCTVVVL